MAFESGQESFFGKSLGRISDLHHSKFTVRNETRAIKHGKDWRRRTNACALIQVKSSDTSVNFFHRNWSAVQKSVPCTTEWNTWADHCTTVDERLSRIVFKFQRPSRNHSTMTEAKCLLNATHWMWDSCYPRPLNIQDKMLYLTNVSINIQVLCAVKEFLPNLSWISEIWKRWNDTCAIPPGSHIPHSNHAAEGIVNRRSGSRT